MISSVLNRVLLALLVGVTSCTPESPESMGPEGFSLARSVGAGVELRNPTARPVYYAAFEREFATRVKFAPCSDPERCPSVAPGATRTIPLAEVTGYEPGAKAVIVYYWHLMPREGGHVVEGLDSVVLPVRS